MKHTGALLLSFCILCAGVNARAEDFVTVLTEQNIRTFLEESKNMSTSRDFSTDPADIAKYFRNHLAEKGTFASKTRYELPGFPVQEAEMKLEKEDYISYIMEGANLLEGYNAAVEVKELKISSSGKSATLKTTTTETGNLLWPDEQGEKKQIPIQGVSECEQRLVVSLNNYIQMAQADCATLISFAPFGDTPLGE